jgi:pimeloyl-ACP methyl ester carboxylesterase
MLEDVERRRLTLEGSGVEIALLDWGGDGPLALLHHANGFCAGTFGVVAACLRSSFRVVAMDARGHGDSSKPPVHDGYNWEQFGLDVGLVARALLRERGDERIALGLGHSFGGTAILRAAADTENLFERLLLVDPVIGPPPGVVADGRRAEGAAALAAGALRRRHTWKSRSEARAGWRDKPLFASWDPRVLDLYVEEGLVDLADGGVGLKCPGAVEAAIFSGGGLSDVWEAASRLEPPALILWAQHGDFPRAAYEALAARMRAGRVEDIDTGHLVPMERPEEVAARALGFAAEG